MGASEGFYVTSKLGFGFATRLDRYTAYGNSMSSGFELSYTNKFENFRGNSTSFVADIDPSVGGVTNLTANRNGFSIMLPKTGPSLGGSYGAVRSTTSTTGLNGLSGLMALP